MGTNQTTIYKAKEEEDRTQAHKEKQAYQSLLHSHARGNCGI